MKYIDNINNIEFSNVQEGRVYIGMRGPLTCSSSYKKDDGGNIVHRANDYLVNAIDIHWNGFEVDGKKINTTADLVAWVNSIKDTVEELNPSIKNLENAIYRYQEVFDTVLSKTYADEHYQAKGEYVTNEEINEAFEDINANFGALNAAIEELQNRLDGESSESDDTKTFDPSTLEDYATKTYVDNELINKAEVGDSYTKNESDAKYLTEHQSLEGYATESYVDEMVETIVGAAPENFDTLVELADAMDGLKVVDVEAVEGEHYTQEEIDAAQEGDEAYGKTVNDWKIEPVAEESHNMTITEFVNASIETVNEKPQVDMLKTKYNALLSLLNLRDTDVNNVIINQELAESSTITFEDGTVDNVVIPVTTQAYTVTVPLENNSTVTLSSNKYMTLFNTSEEPVSTIVQRPAETDETGTSGTTVYLVGNFDTLTLENISPNVKSGQPAASANNVVITENNTKNLSLSLDLQDGATITNNSATNVTINDKNNESTVLTIVAPNSTVTLNGGTYTTLEASVSDNTLIIKKTAHIGTLNVTKGNVTVEVPRSSDIASIIDNINIADGYSIDYLHDDITSANISKLTTTGTHVLQENIAKTGNFSVGLFSSDDIVWDLNGHDLTSSNTRGFGIFSLRGSAHLEINDSVGGGTIRNTSDEYGFWTTTNDSKVVVNGGNFEAATHVLYAQKGTIEVNGGSFKLTNAATADKDQNGNFKFLLNCHDEDYVNGNAKIIVRGGKFYGFNPAETYGEPNGPVSYVAEGYESIIVNESYEYGAVYEVRPISQ